MIRTIIGTVTLLALIGAAPPDTVKATAVAQSVPAPPSSSPADPMPQSAASGEPVPQTDVTAAPAAQSPVPAAPAPPAPPANIITSPVTPPSAAAAPAPRSSASASVIIQGGGGMLPILAPQNPMLMQQMMQRQRAEFERVRVEQLALRQTMLATLTPAHRALLAQIVGELTVAPNPDSATAVARLNGALFPAEAAGVVRADQARQAAMMREFSQLTQLAGEHGFPKIPPLSTMVHSQIATPNGRVGFSAGLATMPARYSFAQRRCR